MAGGRAAGEEAEHVVEEIRALDVFARRTLPDVHTSRTYLVRLSAVYGKPPLEMKVSLRSVHSYAHLDLSCLIAASFRGEERRAAAVIVFLV